MTNSILLAKELVRDPLIGRINQLQPVWVILGLVLPMAVEGAWTGTWAGALKGLLWGGFVRLFLVQQVVATTNSICYLYGDRPFGNKNYSTNNIWLAIVSLGQSWHNKHHAFPHSSTAGLVWWQTDVSTWTIWFLEFLGLVSDANVPTSEMIQAKRIVR